MSPAALALAWAGCAVAPRPAAPPPPVAAEAPSAAPPGNTGSQGERVLARARWMPTDYSQLPGWNEDAVQETWPALRAGCVRPPAAWAAFCQRLRAFTPPDAAYAREFIERELQPWRLEAGDGNPVGLATGYFEPLLAASRLRTPLHTVPILKPPPDLPLRRPYWTRKELETDPLARSAVAGQEIAWLNSSVDLLMLQIQGSGRLRVTEPDGRERDVRVAFAAHNDQPYGSVGRWLIQQGELKPEGATWPAIKDWALRAPPARLAEMLHANPRVVFFREEPLPDPSIGPKGAQGVPLTPARSVAVDPLAVPYGTPMWLETTEVVAAPPARSATTPSALPTTSEATLPAGWALQPLRRLVVAQDTGGAIVGAVRIDLFAGWGPDAEQRAGRMKQPLRAWALWPRQGPLPRLAATR